MKKDDKLHDINTVIVHGGQFHLDEILAVALLKIAGLRFNTKRTRELPKNKDEKTLIMDTGMIYDPDRLMLDHHQSGAPKRENGITYSSVGLLWKDFGRNLAERILVKYSDRNNIIRNDDITKLWETVDRELIMGTDAWDNGQEIMPLDCLAPINIAELVAAMNPSDAASSDFAFDRTAAVIYVLIGSWLCSVCERQAAENIIKWELEKAAAAGTPYACISAAVPWKQIIQDDKELYDKTLNIAAVCFAKDGAVGISAMPSDRKTRTGIRVNLKNAKQTKGITFVHESGYFALAEDIETAKRFITEAAKQMTNGTAKENSAAWETKI